MFGYYFNLALRSFRRNKILTALMVLAIALGIGASMTTLTVFYVLSGDPIPQKSDRLFSALRTHTPRQATSREKSLATRSLASMPKRCCAKNVQNGKR